MSKVTIFKNIRATGEPSYIDYKTALTRISSGKSKAAVEAVRMAQTKSDVTKFKERLPLILFSGVFDKMVETSSGFVTYSSEESQSEHNGLICLDFDGLEGSADTFKEMLSEDSIIHAAWISPSGEGVKALVKIANPDKHREHFYYLMNKYPELDASGENVNRGCYESYDPYIYINEDSEVLSDMKEEKPASIIEKKNANIVSDPSLIKTCVALIANSVDGAKHEAALKAGFLAGGFIGGGLVNDEEIVKAMEAAMRERCGDDDRAYREHMRAVYSGIQKGKTKPIDEIKEDLDAADRHKRIEMLTLEDFVEGDLDKEIQQYIQTGEIMGLDTGSDEWDKYFRFKHNFCINLGHSNVGKALSLSTKIPTPNGWTTMGDLQTGDVVYDELGKICKVIHATKVMENKTVYRITLSNGEKVDACEDHLWTLDVWGNGEKVVTTRDIANDTINVNGKNKYKLPKVLPIEGFQQTFNVSPYVLGLWLGDGYSKSSRIAYNKLDLSELLQQIQAEGYKTKVAERHDCISISGEMPLYVALRSYNLYNNKHIPVEYLRGSIDSRIALLQGLMDTDGHCYKRGTCEYCTVIPDLRDGFCELLSSLGIKYSITTKPRRGCKDAYYISFSAPSDKWNPFRLTRKAKRVVVGKRGLSVYITGIERIESIPVRCIEVNSQSKLFRFGETMQATHNSTFSWWIAVVSAKRHGWKWGVYSSENTLWRLKKKLMEFYFSKPLLSFSKAEVNEATHWVDEHFFFISNKNTYNYKHILDFATKLVEEKQIDAMLLDPYNSLRKESEDTHNYDYLALSELLTWTKRYDRMMWCNMHTVTEAQRLRDTKTNKVKRPYAAHAEGGGKNVNRCDDLFVTHRNIHTASESNITEFYVDKVREVETGGRPTLIDDPLKFVMLPDGCGFTINGFNPITKEQSDGIF